MSDSVYGSLSEAEADIEPLDVESARFRAKKEDAACWPPQPGPFWAIPTIGEDDGTGLCYYAIATTPQVWKVFRETAKGLVHCADADQYGDFIIGKYKRPTGRFIPWSELH